MPNDTERDYVHAALVEMFHANFFVDPEFGPDILYYGPTGTAAKAVIENDTLTITTTEHTYRAYVHIETVN